MLQNLSKILGAIPEMSTVTENKLGSKTKQCKRNWLYINNELEARAHLIKLPSHTHIHATEGINYLKYQRIWRCYSGDSLDLFPFEHTNTVVACYWCITNLTHGWLVLR